MRAHENLTVNQGVDKQTVKNSLPEKPINKTIPRQSPEPYASHVIISPSPITSQVASQPPSTVETHKWTKTRLKTFRAQVTEKLKVHQEHIQQLNLKLQLIDHISSKLELTTTAYPREGQTIMADFVIDNPTTYVLKDITISFD